jgi:hypothetical protein
MSKPAEFDTLPRWEKPARQDWYSELLRERSTRQATAAVDWFAETEHDALARPVKITIRGNGIDVVRALLEGGWGGVEH